MEEHLWGDNSDPELVELSPINGGLYIDAAGDWYLCLTEFIAANQLPDSPQVRQALLDEICLGFPEIICVEFCD